MANAKPAIYHRLREQFEKHDVDNDEVLTKDELIACLKSIYRTLAHVSRSNVAIVKLLADKEERRIMGTDLEHAEVTFAQLLQILLSPASCFPKILPHKDFEKLQQYVKDRTGQHDKGNTDMGSACLESPMFQAIVNDLVVYNKHLLSEWTSETQLHQAVVSKASFNADGSVASWDLDGFGLKTLPDSICILHFTDNLILSNNRLKALPASFGKVRVDGDLTLDGNKLISLPESFGHLRVGGDLWLNSNDIKQLPASIEGAQVGGDMNLEQNRLSSVPKSFTGSGIQGFLSLAENDFAPSTNIKLQEQFSRLVIDTPSDGLRVSGVYDGNYEYHEHAGRQQ